MPQVHGHVLVVDDDALVLRAYARALMTHGWLVTTAPDGKQAIELLRARSFDAIVSDVAMPEMSGLEFLRTVREHDLDVPVILVTGEPGLDSAVQAVEYGAFRYLLKPVSARDLEDTVHSAMQLHSMARLKREALDVVGIERRRLGDRAGLEARFAMAMQMFWMAYQPIVSLSGHDVFGYEALLRSHEPTMRGGARDVLDAAERLGLVQQLGRATRARVAADAAKAPRKGKLLVNLHALELTDNELYSEESPLARIAPFVVLEFTERASLNGIPGLVSRVKRLRELGFQIALDDLGGGYAGLMTYSRLEPDMVKIDMGLVRDIDSAPRKERIVGAMIRLCNELGTRVVAEGVETMAERDKLAELGCDLLQGYLYAGPEHGFLRPRWSLTQPQPGANRVGAA